MKSAEFFNLFCGNFSSIFGVFMGRCTWLRPSIVDIGPLLTTHLQYFICLFHFVFERGSHSVTQIGLKLTRYPRPSLNSQKFFCSILRKTVSTGIKSIFHIDLNIISSVCLGFVAVPTASFISKFMFIKLYGKSTN